MDTTKISRRTSLEVMSMKAHSKLQLTLEHTGARGSDPCAVGYPHISSDSSVGSSYTRIQPTTY